MIVVMKKDATKQNVDNMVERIESLGLKAHVIVGTERTVIAAVGDDRKTHKESLESGVGVEEVMPILAPYKVASLELKKEPTTIRVGSLTVGGGTIGVIAGPCSVESEDQIMQVAAGQPRIVGDVVVAGAHRLQRKGVEEMLDRRRHRVDVAGGAGHRLGQHVAVAVEDPGREIAGLAHRRRKRRAHQRLRLFLDYGNQPRPHDLQMNLRQRGIRA